MGKKYFILIMIVFFSMQAAAQSLALKDLSNNPINNGDTVIVTGDTSQFIIYSQCNLHNISSTGKMIGVKKLPLSVISGTDASFDIGILHYPPSSTLSLGDTMIQGDSIAFYARYYTYGNPGSSYYMFTFFDMNNTSDSIAAIFEFRVTPLAGVYENVSKPPLSIFYSGNGQWEFTFSEPIRNQALVEIMNADGKLVVKKIISEHSNSLIVDLSGNSKGVYICRFSDLSRNKVIQRRIILH